MPYEQTEGIFDFGLWPSNYHSDVQVFSCTNNSTNNASYQRWIKPRGVTMCFIIVVGGGAGGGGGATGASTTARGGGGGGGSSSTARLLIPALFVPDNLLISVGNGGKGAVAGGIGSSGFMSIVSFGQGVNNSQSVPNAILISGSAGAVGGAAGTNATGGAGGAAGTIATAGNSGAHINLGFWQATVGNSGSAGGAQTGAVGATVTAGFSIAGTAVPFTPGAGGAGVNSVGTGFAGGPITVSLSIDLSDGLITSVAGGLAGSAAAAGNGNPGHQYYKPLLTTGGTGGGSSDGSTGGRGGNGGIGSGGGGGGGGVTGGSGGDGGDGIVIIISW